MPDVSPDEGVPERTHRGRRVAPETGGDHGLRGTQGLQGGEGIAGKPGPQSEQVGEKVQGGKLQERAGEQPDAQADRRRPATE